MKKNKEKTTIPLDVFNGPNNIPSQLNSYGERITKLQSIKRSVEVNQKDKTLEDSEQVSFQLDSLMFQCLTDDFDVNKVANITEFN